MGELCPDRQLLSVYFDGELPSPWKEKMEAHIAGCGECARQLNAYKRNSLPSAGEDNTTLESARQRVWQKTEQRIQNWTPGPVRQFYPGAGVWKRRISVPLPAAAAIALFVFAAFFIALRITGAANTSAMSSFASDVGPDMPGIIPVSDMADVLQYLDSSDSGDLIILRLPESRSFVSYSEPVIINAADYSRNVSNRPPDRFRDRNVKGGKQ